MAASQVVLLPRTTEQGAALADTPGVIVPVAPVDGPSLLWVADAVVSAGGTMNREAALLGVPTWTTFAGELGAVDRWLVAEGRLRVAPARRGRRGRQAAARGAGPRGHRGRGDRGDPPPLSLPGSSVATDPAGERP